MHDATLPDKKKQQQENQGPTHEDAIPEEQTHEHQGLDMCHGEEMPTSSYSYDTTGY